MPQLTLIKIAEDTYSFDVSKLENFAEDKLLQLSSKKTSLPADLVYLVFPEKLPGNYNYQLEFTEKLIIKGNIPPNT